MFTRILLPLLAVLGVGFAVFTVMAEGRPRPATPPAVPPATATFESKVAGAGLVEASTENIAIGTHVPGIITRVHVKAGDVVKAGDPLFTIDDRTVRAEIATREAALRIAQARIERLKAEPRPEDIPAAEARVAADRAVLDDLQSQLTMWEKADRRAVSEEDLSKRRYAVASAQARLLQSSADLAKLRAGAWRPEIDVAQAEVESAQAHLAAIRTELERHTVAAPVTGQVLKVDARPGEFAPAAAEKSLITLGDTSTLHVRVDVDENDAWRVKSGSSGRAFVRGNPDLSTPIRFVRFEPYVIPKRSLTGASTERVDTRVLQVIYAFDPRDLPVFVGQQMDVFIDESDASSAPAANHLPGAKPQRASAFPEPQR